MGKAPAFQFYAAEYLADERVQLLTLEQEGAYIRLLAYCWREGSIPADLVKLSRLCKGAQVDALAGVVELFIPGDEGRLLHKRLEDERIKQAEYRNKQAENGGKGGRPRKEKPNQTQTKGLGLFGETQTKAKKSSSSAFASSSSSATESKKQKPSHAKREVDPRHSQFREFTCTYWDHKNPEIAMPWDGSEARQLSSFLAANPAMDGDAFKELLRHRAKSQVNHAERPRAWLSKVTDYAGGPLNEFNKPLGGESGKCKGKTESSLDSARAVVKAIENRHVAGAPGYPTPNQIDDGRVSGLLDGPRALRYG